MEHERLRDLVLRPAASPHRALAQKYLRNQLQKHELHQGLHYSGTDLTIENLDIQEMMGLRSGPFTRSPFQTFKVDVQNIRHLDIAVVPFWKGAASKVSSEKPGSSGAVVDSGKSTGSSYPHFPEEQKNGLKILHDWLSSFPPSNIKVFRFEWVGLLDGTNPLLLDKLAEQLRGLGKEAWFSAPPLAWRGLETLRLKGVDVTDDDVVVLKKRNRRLKSVIVETYWTKEQIESGWVSEDPGEREIDILKW